MPPCLALGIKASIGGKQKNEDLESDLKSELDLCDYTLVKFLGVHFTLKSIQMEQIGSVCILFEVKLVYSVCGM